MMPRERLVSRAGLKEQADTHVACHTQASLIHTASRVGAHRSDSFNTDQP